MTLTMLPSAPKDVGILSHVFVSALASVTGVGENKLGLRRVDSAVVFMVDGLGAQNLADSLSYAANIRKFLDGAKMPSCRVEFPATTAVSLTSLGTGLRSGAHGIAGYQVLSSTGEQVNMLSGWNAEVKPAVWQPRETVAEQALSLGVSAYFVGPSEYENSGFTEVFMRGVKYVSAESMGERVSKALTLAASKGSLIYCYFPELDKAAHRYGVTSSQWLALLEELDAALAPAVTARCGVLLTADHGVQDVTHDQQIVLNDLPGYNDAVTTTSGDPRVAYINGDAKAAREALSAVESRVTVCTHDELVTAGWCLEHTGQSKKPDLYAIARGATALYDLRFASLQSTKMIGQHGGIDDIEQRVPLLRLGAYR